MSIKLEGNIALNKAELKEKKSFFQKEIHLFGSKFNDKKRERFYADLRVLLQAGIDLKSALEIIISEQQKEKERLFFKGIYNAVLQGKSLAEALETAGRFSEYEFYSIQIGEESNRLPEVLEELATYFAGQAALKKQIISVLSYPAFVFVITLGLVYFMLTSVVPMFADVFKQFGSELPPLTKKIVALSENFPFYFMAFVGVTGAVVFLVYSQRQKEWFRSGGSALLLRIPLVGHLVKLTYMARFTQSLHLLLASRTPLVRSLELTGKMIRFYPLQKAISQLQHDITVGKTLHESMSGFTLFPRRMVSLIKVGEEVNQLDVMLKKLSDQYADEIKHLTQIIGKIMEPMIMLVIGLVVGVILVAMYMPMFNLSNIMQ